MLNSLVPLSHINLILSPLPDGELNSKNVITDIYYDQWNP